MPDQDEVRRIALALPETSEDEDYFGFAVLNHGKRKGFVWAWRERIHPKKARVPSTTVVAVRVADLQEKEALLASGDDSLFTEPHYNGYPAVLVRLESVRPETLAELIEDAWRCQAPRALVAAYLAEQVTTAPTPKA